MPHFAPNGAKSFRMNICHQWYRDRPVFRPLRPFETLDLETVFERPQPLEVELGAGDGSFILPWATSHPTHNFIAVERLLGRARKMERRARRAGWSHLIVTRLEASHVLKRVIPAASASALHVYFPDPWPKKRHANRRLVSPGFPELAAQALQPGGLLHLRTDNVPYFDQMKEVFANAPQFVAETPPERLVEIRTTFEQHFNAQGIPTNYLSLRFQPSR